MPKALSGSMLAHLGQDTTALCTCWKITRRDGVVIGFTDHDVDIPLDGVTYLSAVGYTRTAVDNDLSMAVDNLEVEGLIDSETITTEELRAGVYDKAVVEIFAVNWQDLSMGIIRLRKGWFGEVFPTTSGVFRTEIRGLGQALSQKILEVSSPECRADLGDHRCKLPIAPQAVARGAEYALGVYVRVAGMATEYDVVYKCVQAGTTAAEAPAYSDTPGMSTTDGTAIFTAENGWTRGAAVSEATAPSQKVVVLNMGTVDPRALADPGWYNVGVLVCTQGRNAGNAFEIKSWLVGPSGVAFTLALPMPYSYEFGDTFYVVPGCDKRYTATCIGKFNNRLNFRGEPFLPGQDLLMQYPDAR